MSLEWCHSPLRAHCYNTAVSLFRPLLGKLLLPINDSTALCLPPTDFMHVYYWGANLCVPFITLQGIILSQGLIPIPSKTNYQEIITKPIFSPVDPLSTYCLLNIVLGFSPK